MLLEVDCFNLWFREFSVTGHEVLKQALCNISISLDRGETVAIVGESGSGKSVTALSILRLLETISEIKSEGAIRFEGTDLYTLSAEQLRKIRGNKIAMIFQEPMSCLNPVYTIGNQVLEPLLLHRQLTGKEAKNEAVRLLKRTGIDSPEMRLQQYPHQLSGGQRQRVMIAMALACSPTLLIADEPTTALDVTIQSQILELIKGLQIEFSMGVLLITHDLNLVHKHADRTYIMKHGEIVEHGKTTSIFESPAHWYTKTLMNTIPHIKEEKTTFPVDLLEAKNIRCDFNLPTQWKFPFKREKRKVHAVKDVDLIIPQGATIGLVGESGSGKTTLGMALLRLVHSSGEIRFANTKIDKLSNKQLRPHRADMQIVFQDPFSSLSPRFTVLEIIEEGLKVHQPGLTKNERQRKVIATLKEVELEAEVLSRYPHEFSGGQRQRIAIARSIILRPKLLVLDEPTSALDVTIQQQILELLLKLQKKLQMSYLFISHDLRVVRSISDRLVIMKDGEIIESGPASEIFSNPRHEYTKTLFKASFGESPGHY